MNKVFTPRGSRSSSDMDPGDEGVRGTHSRTESQTWTRHSATGDMSWTQGRDCPPQPGPTPRTLILTFSPGTSSSRLLISGVWTACTTHYTHHTTFRTELFLISKIYILFFILYRNVHFCFVSAEVLYEKIGRESKVNLIFDFVEGWFKWIRGWNCNEYKYNLYINII